MLKGVGAALAGCLAITASQAFAADAPLPRLSATGSGFELLVDGRPYIALAGEVHNSTASSAEYMAPAWDRLAALHVNTVITPAYWELVEPVEGRYDFSLIDEQIRQAQQRKMRIVLLWFGTLKNARSTYAPAWVRRDQVRFPRAGLRESASPLARGDPPISVFGEAVVAADARAFGQLMTHLAATDTQHTVIAVQVENEAGILGDSRDRSRVADAAWRGQVPSALIRRLQAGGLAASLDAVWARNGRRTSGTWGQVFGDDWQAEEVFMAWGVASLVDRVAAAGKKQLALPMYANAWLGPQKPEDKAGAYPSGGPVPRVHDVWRLAAPHLDWLSPDIYLDDFDTWARAYARTDNPLFIPETQYVACNMFTAFGAYRAIGFAPFGIEDGLPDSQVAAAYGHLAGMTGVLARAQATGDVHGFALEPGAVDEVKMGGYVVRVRSQREALRQTLLDIGVQIPATAPERKAQTGGAAYPTLSDIRPCGLVIQLAKDEFLVLGKDVDVTFTREGAKAPEEIERVEDGRYVDERWTPGRVLNGDERLSILPSDSFGAARFRLLRPR